MGSVLLCAVLIFAIPAIAEVPDLCGSWKLDRDLTTADLRWNKISSLVIEQSQGEIRFDYFDRDKRHVGWETFLIDGKERHRYTTRMLRAYARARWSKNELEVITRVFLDVLGYQSYSETDWWRLSEDGRTLTNRSSDGKAMVYQREAAELIH
jgi:hypothetical protein